MRAFVVHPGSGDSRLADWDAPVLGQADEVLVEVLEVGLCGTDRDIVAGVYGKAPAGYQDLVLGHECLARVAEIGAAVRTLAIGDLVIPTVRRPCDAASCAPCRSEHQDFCRSGRFTDSGIEGAHGFLAEQVVVRERHLVVMPPGVRAVGVLVEPLTVAEKALAQLPSLEARLPEAARAGSAGGALVVGAGPVGLLAAFALRLRGWEVVVASRSSSSTPKAALARAAGANYISTGEVPVNEIGSQRGGFGLVFEAVGDATAVVAALGALAPNGVLVSAGIPHSGGTAGDLAAALRALVLGNRVILGSVNASRNDFEAAVTDLQTMHERWPSAVEGLITHRVPFEQAPAALEVDRPIKAVVSVKNEGGRGET